MAIFTSRQLSSPKLACYKKRFFKSFISREQAFTLIEMLVVLGVVGGLSAFLVLYNRTAARQLILAREQVGIIDLISRAKFLSLQTYLEGLETGVIEPICGYGVHFDASNDTAFIFKDLDPVDQSLCFPNATDRIYRPILDPGNPGPQEDEVLEGQRFNISLDPLVRFSSSSNLTDIVFVPPVPKVILEGNDSIVERDIIIETIQGDAFVTIKVDNGGHISTQ